jgi:heme ABC exporter ATP-binding subunit CcmA
MTDSSSLVTRHSSLVTVRQLTKAYDLLPVLRKLDLDVQRGECVALLGANGSGKSTLLRLLAGMSKPSSGTISVGGWELPREAANVRAQIGMVGHKPLLYENLSARENLAFFARLYNLPSAEREARIAALLARVGLAKRAHDLMRTFSRGMQQRLSIARALLHQPAVLLFDEPYTGLDQQGAAMLDEIIAETRAGGQTILMSTHELDRAARLAGRVIILARGQIGYDAPNSDGTGLAAVYAETVGAK